MQTDTGALTDRWIAAAIALGLFVIYALGAARTIWVGDSGELVTAVHVLGIPHPSGYPLYVLLGKLWTLIVPIGSIAFRMSLFSAACAAGACALLFATVRQDGGSRVAGLLAAGMLAFGPSFWHEANIQRVYALNALILVLAVNRALAWFRDRKPRDLVVAMLVCGIGATNHTIMVLIGVAIAIWAPIVEPALFRRAKLIAACGGAFFAGLAIYAWLPLRSRMNPLLNWGEPATLDGFLDVVLRRDYWERAWWEGPADLLPVARDWASSLVAESGYAGVVLALIAFVAGARRKWLLAGLILVINLLALARHGSFQDIFVWHRYYIPSYAMIAILAGAGLDVIRERLQQRRLVAVALAVPILMLAAGYVPNDRSAPSVADSFARGVLDSLPPGAMLLTTDDNVLFPLLYMKWVERLRPDIVLVPLGVKQTKQDFTFDPDVDAIFFTHHPNWKVADLAFAQRGIVLQAIRAGRPLPPANLLGSIEQTDRSLPHADYLTRMLIAHHHFSLALTWETRDWQRARAELAAAATVAPPLNDITSYNVAMVLARNGFYDEALGFLRKAHGINPRGGINLAPGRGPETRYSAAKQIEIVTAERDDAARAEEAIANRLNELERGSSAWHLAMAERLSIEGYTAAARRHLILGNKHRE